MSWRFLSTRPRLVAVPCAAIRVPLLIAKTVKISSEHSIEQDRGTGILPPPTVGSRSSTVAVEKKTLLSHFLPLLLLLLNFGSRAGEGRSDGRTDGRMLPLLLLYYYNIESIIVTGDLNGRRERKIAERGFLGIRGRFQCWLFVDVAISEGRFSLVNFILYFEIHKVAKDLNEK